MYKSTMILIVPFFMAFNVVSTSAQQQQSPPPVQQQQTPAATEPCSILFPRSTKRWENPYICLRQSVMGNERRLGSFEWFGRRT